MALSQRKKGDGHEVNAAGECLEIWLVVSSLLSSSSSLLSLLVPCCAAVPVDGETADDAHPAASN